MAGSVVVLIGLVAASVCLSRRYRRRKSSAQEHGRALHADKTYEHAPESTTAASTSATPLIPMPMQPHAVQPILAQTQQVGQGSRQKKAPAVSDPTGNVAAEAIARNMGEWVSRAEAQASAAEGDGMQSLLFTALATGGTVIATAEAGASAEGESPGTVIAEVDVSDADTIVAWPNGNSSPGAGIPDDSDATAPDDLLHVEDMAPLLSPRLSPRLSPAQTVAIASQSPTEPQSSALSPRLTPRLSTLSQSEHPRQSDTTVHAANRAMDTAVPGANRATDTAVPAVNSAMDTAVPAVNSATDTAVPAAKGGTDTTVPAANSATDTAVPAAEPAAKGGTSDALFAGEGLLEYRVQGTGEGLLEAAVHLAERATGIDFDGDGVIGPPTEPAPVVCPSLVTRPSRPSQTLVARGRSTRSCSSLPAPARLPAPQASLPPPPNPYTYTSHPSPAIAPSPLPPSTCLSPTSSEQLARQAEAAVRVEHEGASPSNGIVPAANSATDTTIIPAANRATDTAVPAAKGGTSDALFAGEGLLEYRVQGTGEGLLEAAVHLAERATGIDFDGDGVIGPPTEPAPVVCPSLVTRPSRPSQTLVARGRSTRSCSSLPAPARLPAPQASISQSHSTCTFACAASRSSHCSNGEATTSSTTGAVASPASITNPAAIATPAAVPVRPAIATEPSHMESDAPATPRHAPCRMSSTTTGRQTTTTAEEDPSSHSASPTVLPTVSPGIEGGREVGVAGGVDVGSNGGFCRGGGSEVRGGRAGGRLSLSATASVRAPEAESPPSTQRVTVTPPTSPYAHGPFSPLPEETRRVTTQRL